MEENMGGKRCTASIKEKTSEKLTKKEILMMVGS